MPDLSPFASWTWAIINRQDHENTSTCILFWLLKPHFYIVKLGYIHKDIHYFFLFLLKIIDCGYALELPHLGGSNEYSQSMFWAEIWKL